MATADSVKAKIQGLIASANAKTGNTDANLTTAVNTLIDGFGQGGGVELPALTNPGSASDLAQGKQLIGADGSVVTGTLIEDKVLQIWENVSIETDDGTIEMVAPVTEDCILREGVSYSRLIANSSAFGDASPGDVRKGVYFTSSSGVHVRGEMETENGVELPTLTNPGSADDLVSGKQLIGADGSVVEGSVPVGSDWSSGLYKHFEQSELRNPYEPDDKNYFIDLDMVAKNDVLVRGGAKLPIYIWGDKLGTAKPEDVAQGATFTSESGLKIDGSLPTPNGVEAICDLVEGGNNNTFAVEGNITEDVILRKDKFVYMVVDPSKFGDFGTAKPEDVRAGVTFTSAAGYAMAGALETGGGGGSSVITEEWQRPSNWPDLSSLGKPAPGTTYLTFDCRDFKQGINYEVTLDGFTINGIPSSCKRGYVENGEFVPVETIPWARKLSINYDMDGRDFVVYELVGMRGIGISGSNHRQVGAFPLLETYGTAYPGNNPFYGGNSYSGSFSARTKSVNVSDVELSEPLMMSSYNYPCTIEYLNTDGWTLKSGFVNLTGVFCNFTHLRKIKLTFDTSLVTSMSQMFSSDFSLEEVDISASNTSSVTSMQGMFAGCRSLRKLDLKHFNTSKVTNFGNMFNGCYNLYDLDFSSLDTSAVAANTTLTMFQDCDNLTNLKVGKITVNFRFTNCNKLSHDSLMNVINALEPTDTTLTLTIGSTNIAKLTEAELAIATEKGWTVV